MIIRKIIPVLFLLSAVIINAESEKNIKLSDNFYYGEGIRDSACQAKSDAINDLLYKLSVTLTSQSKYSTEENNETIHEDFSKRTRLYSAIKLKGINFLEKVWSNDRCKVIAYISKADYDKSMKDLAENVREHFKVSEEIEKQYGIETAAIYYYKAYLLTFYSPQSISYTNQSTGKSYNNLKPYLENKIRSYLCSVKVIAGEPDIDALYPDQIVVPFTFERGSNPINDLSVRLNMPGNPERQLDNSKADLFIYSQPTKIEEPFEIIYQIKILEDAELGEIDRDFGIRETKKIKVDFSKIIKVDFTITNIDGGFFKFSPQIKNLSIAKLRWEFGDLSTSAEFEPIHKYLKEGEYEVCLIINESEQLTIKKTINNNSTLLKEIPLNAEKEDIQKKNAAASVTTKTVSIDTLTTALADTITEAPVGITKTEKKVNPTLSILLSEIKKGNSQKILELLKSLKLSGSLIYGRESSFMVPEKCYILVFANDNENVTALISPAEPDRIDLLSNKKITSVNEECRNMRAIWLELY